MSTAKVPLHLTENSELHDILQLMIVPRYKYDGTSITSGFVYQPQKTQGDLDFEVSNPANCCPAESHLAKV